MNTAKRRWKSAIAYGRVSTEAQGESGVGLEGQIAAIEKYAELARYRITETFHDVGSGRGEKNLVNREGLQSAITLAKETSQPIIIADLDRISRHSRTIQEIVSGHGITIISAGDGELLNPIIVASKAARAEREGELISERIKEALAHKQAAGVKLGNTKNLPEAQRLAVLKTKEIADNTVSKIADVLVDVGREVNAPELVVILNERGVKTSRKSPWTVSALRRPLKRARELLKDRKPREENEFYKGNPLFGRFG